VILEYFIYSSVCRLFIFLGKKFPITNFIRWKFLTELFSCDLCLGVYICFGLAFIFKVNVFEEFYIIGVSEFITGSITSFLLYLLKLGWDTAFGEIVIEG
jgi:hypothetical protein